jgi:hypothetical protein
LRNGILVLNSNRKGFIMESMSLGLIILLVVGVASLLIRIFKSPPNKTDNLATPSINIIKPKIAFAGSYVFCKDKIIVKDLGLFDEENLSAIQGFIRSISPSALELHPVFDHTLIGQDGVYKYWWFLPDGKNKDVSIRIQITCLDRKGKVIFHFTKGHNVYSDFVFNGEETLLNKTFYMELDYPEDRKLEFSNEEWLKQKEKPVLVKITFRPDRLPPVPDKYGHTLQEHDITYYDYFLFMDRLIKIEKTIGDSEKKEELIQTS